MFIFWGLHVQYPACNKKEIVPDIPVKNFKCGLLCKNPEDGINDWVVQGNLWNRTELGLQPDDYGEMSF